MKKWIIGITLILLFILSGCNTTTNEVTPFRTAINNFDIHETSGYYFKTTQTQNDDVLNQDWMDLRIDWSSEKMYTEFYEKSLNDFDSTDLFKENSYTTYYFNNQIGYQELENDITWQVGTLDEYLTAKLPIKTMSTKLFTTYEITETDTHKTISGRMATTQGLLGYCQEIDYLDIVFTVTKDLKVVSIEITIQLLSTTIQMTFEVYYEPQVVIIP